MNINDVAKREILDFEQFRNKVHDNSYKPFSPENQDGGEGKTGLHKIKREPAYDWVGYADAVFSPEKAGIEVPGYNAKGDRDYINGVGAADIYNPGMRATMDTSESNLTNIVKRVIKENDSSSENIEESFDPMVGIDNFLNNPIMITLATAWLLSGKFKLSNLKSNLEEMKNDFFDYCNSMGYSIDKGILDLKFKQLIHRIKNIINL